MRFIGNNLVECFLALLAGGWFITYISVVLKALGIKQKGN